MSLGEKICRIENIRVFGENAEEMHGEDMGNCPKALEKAAAILKRAFDQRPRVPACEILITVTDLQDPAGVRTRNLSFSVTNGELLIAVPR